MGIAGAQQIAGHAAETTAARAKNNAKLKNYDRQIKQQDVVANLDNVQYLNDVQEQDADQDATYQAMLDQWSDTDRQLQGIFHDEDFKVEEAIVAMHENSYAGTQTGRTAGRLAAKSAVELGRIKSRSLHNKMMAVKDATTQKERTYRGAKHDSHKLFMNVAFAPTHGFRPAQPALEAGPSKAGLILGLAGTGMQGYKAFKSNRPGGVNNPNWSEREMVDMGMFT